MLSWLLLLVESIRLDSSFLSGCVFCVAFSPFAIPAIVGCSPLGVSLVLYIKANLLKPISRGTIGFVVLL